MGETDQGVLITTTQMYAEMRSLHDTVTRIDTKLDGLITSDADTAKTLADHETRLRHLEQRMWRASGVAAVLGAGAGIAAQVLMR